MLPFSIPNGWQPVPDAEPNTRSVAFEAVYNGTHILATGMARDGQVDLIPTPGQLLEIKFEVWRGIAPFLTVAALNPRRDIPPTGGGSPPG